ncbi:MAG: transcriptional repressor LexA [Zymomonas mobilis subsp. pomaceae]|uniref:LexA repressor n=1 Tax=Zymomonas mobilis subsp. pomaceae (strain ATCC 29192 / DSM 22645 / JCM 10191 / CCUG 17912 / NBRC 13757 / NCIMB 11200 / NRRL B-4491 / Barker I) TaxID=579138 RepID=F8ESW6_ZYMMT|nr:transcriptional repressor LexA [Zymomonas mobilis]AEI37870.1 transcriptional repressor, LexA family [Zymomonas mobilis subsp. pomaceae ATCC 29192]MDX5949237.1 transcriptional repressor LexA [Zymomonas mobilis subsp. pomaceae]GEB89534.1 LexA repressor [Zymomonas mobilis subsp. pomaceae]
MLTRKQHDLLLFIHNRLRVSGISPSFEEMKLALDLKSKSGIHRLIKALEERGFIRRLPNRARALEVIRLPENRTDSNQQEKKVRENFSLPKAHNDVVELPLHGRIAAGLPIEALEGQSTLSVPPALLGNGDHYALEVAGDSMVEAGIFDGDFILIRQTDEAHEGEIIVALIDNSDATLKYFHREGRMIRLDPANRAYAPMRYDASRIGIQGRLVGLLRRY